MNTTTSFRLRFDLSWQWCLSSVLSCLLFSPEQSAHADLSQLPAASSPPAVIWAMHLHQSNENRYPGYREKICQVFELAINQIIGINTKEIACDSYQDDLYPTIESIHVSILKEAPPLIDDMSSICRKDQWNSKDFVMMILNQRKFDGKEADGLKFEAYWSYSGRLEFAGEINCSGTCKIDNIDTLLTGSSCYPVKTVRQWNESAHGIVNQLLPQLRVIYEKRPKFAAVMSPRAPSQAPTDVPAPSQPAENPVIPLADVRPPSPLEIRRTPESGTSKAQPTVPPRSAVPAVPTNKPTDMYLALAGKPPDTRLLDAAFGIIWSNAIVGTISSTVLLGLHGSVPFDQTADGHVTNLLGNASRVSLILTVPLLSTAAILTPFYLRHKQQQSKLH